MNTVLDDVTDDRVDAAHVHRRVDEWERRVRDLIAAIEQWLPDGWSAHPGQPMRMNEELMRKFAVPARSIPTSRLVHLAGDTADLEPRGLWIIGANGRVDLTHGDERFLLLDVAGNFQPPAWQACSAQSRANHEPISRDWLHRVLG